MNDLFWNHCDGQIHVVALQIVMLTVANARTINEVRAVQTTRKPSCSRMDILIFLILTSLPKHRSTTMGKRGEV
jgi:hypothetical protein